MKTINYNAFLLLSFLIMSSNNIKAQNNVSITQTGDLAVRVEHQTYVCLSVRGQITGFGVPAFGIISYFDNRIDRIGTTSISYFDNRIDKIGSESISYFNGQIDKIGSSSISYFAGNVDRIGNEPISYFNGSVDKIGPYSITYFNGQIDKIGDETISYFNGRIDKIGSKTISYDFNDQISSNQEMILRVTFSGNCGN